MSWPAVLHSPDLDVCLFNIYTALLDGGPPLPAPSEEANDLARGERWALARLRSPSVAEMSTTWGAPLADFVKRARDERSPPTAAARLRRLRPPPWAHAEALRAYARAQGGSPRGSRLFWKGAAAYAERYAGFWRKRKALDLAALWASLGDHIARQARDPLSGRFGLGAPPRPTAHTRRSPPRAPFRPSPALQRAIASLGQQ